MTHAIYYVMNPPYGCWCIGYTHGIGVQNIRQWYVGARRHDTDLICVVHDTRHIIQDNGPIFAMPTKRRVLAYYMHAGVHQYRERNHFYSKSVPSFPVYEI
jgi:hypothetical protein